MRDYYEEVCSKCKYKDVYQLSSPCKECIDAFFNDWKNPKRKFGKYFKKENKDEVTREEKLRKLKSQLSTAGDRRDWDACERIEKEIEELKGD